jgi:hypothetical protein
MAWWLGLAWHDIDKIIGSRRKQMQREKEFLRRGEKGNHTRVSEFEARRSHWASYISFVYY